MTSKFKSGYNMAALFVDACLLVQKWNSPHLSEGQIAMRPHIAILAYKQLI